MNFFLHCLNKTDLSSCIWSQIIFQKQLKTKSNKKQKRAGPAPRLFFWQKARWLMASSVRSIRLFSTPARSPHHIVRGASSLGPPSDGRRREPPHPWPFFFSHPKIYGRWARSEAQLRTDPALFKKEARTIGIIV